MEGALENNKVLQALNRFGQRLGANKFVASLQAGMMGTVAILMVGAVFSILCAIGVNPQWFTNEDMVYQILYLPYHYTTNLISLWVGGLIAYNYSKALNLKNPLTSTFCAVIIFALVAGGFVITDESGASGINMAFLGAGGMFVAFIVDWAYYGSFLAAGWHQPPCGLLATTAPTWRHARSSNGRRARRIWRLLLEAGERQGEHAVLEPRREPSCMDDGKE